MNINRTRGFFRVKFLTRYTLSIMDIIIKRKKEKKKKYFSLERLEAESRAWPLFFARRKNRRFPAEYFIPARIYARVNEWQAKSPGVMKSCNLRGKCARVITSMPAWFVIVVENISLCKGCSRKIIRAIHRISSAKERKKRKTISVRNEDTLTCWWIN